MRIQIGKSVVIMILKEDVNICNILGIVGIALSRVVNDVCYILMGIVMVYKCIHISIYTHRYIHIIGDMENENNRTD